MHRRSLPARVEEILGLFPTISGGRRQSDGGDGCGCEMSGWSARSLSSCTSVTGSQWRAVSASQRPQGGAYNGSAATKRSALLRSQGSSLMLGFPARQADTPFAINISDWHDRIVRGNCYINWADLPPPPPMICCNNLGT